MSSNQETQGKSKRKGKMQHVSDWHTLHPYKADWLRETQAGK